MKVPLRNHTTLQNTPKIVLLSTLFLVLFTIIPLYYPMLSSLLLWNSVSSYHSYRDDINGSSKVRLDQICDIFSGEWVRNPEAPYYTNTTCWFIYDQQNCMKYERPDTDFMKWRWKPDDCELPLFNPAQFLELMRNKSMAFVGDSVGRNQMHSLICLLSRVEHPIDVSYTTDENFKRWKYTNYNFTIATFWSPYLVRAKVVDPNGPILTRLYNLYLDEFDEAWTTQIDVFDYVIISAGHWFFGQSMYFEDGQLVGCNDCQVKNVTDLTRYYGYRKALRTAFRVVNGLKNFKGTTFLRTFSPSHFENGAWNQGGNCLRTRPFRSNEKRLEGFNLELYMTQVEEFKVAQEEGRERGLKFRLLDITQAMLLRPDGHPSHYGHWPHENVILYNDCVHWCLPGPIDAWNDFLLHMLKMEDGRFYGKLHNGYRKMGNKYHV